MSKISLASIRKPTTNRSIGPENHHKRERLIQQMKDMWANRPMPKKSSKENPRKKAAIDCEETTPIVHEIEIKTELIEDEVEYDTVNEDELLGEQISKLIEMQPNMDSSNLNATNRSNDEVFRVETGRISGETGTNFRKRSVRKAKNVAKLQYLRRIKERRLALEERRMALEERKQALEERKFELDRKEREERLKLEIKDRDNIISTCLQQQKLLDFFIKQHS